MTPLSRYDALKTGATRYFTGTPCKHGHITERYVIGQSCIACAQRRSRGAAGRSHNLKQMYGLTIEQVDAMTAKQGGKCGICRVVMSTGRKRKSTTRTIDHCHKTGKIRGLLCNSCNLNLGKFGDS